MFAREAPKTTTDVPGANFCAMVTPPNAHIFGIVWHTAIQKNYLFLEVRELGLAFEGRKKLVFWFFAFFAKFRPASGDPGLGFEAPFWAPGGVFTARGLEKRKKPKNFESRAKTRMSVVKS